MLEGKTAIVTGAGSGVGLTAARLLAARGARLVLSDARGPKLDAELKLLRDEGAEVVGFCCDLCQRLSISNLVALAMDSFGSIDVLINASRETQLSDPLDTDRAHLEAMLAANLIAPLQLSQAVARRMVEAAEKRESPPPGGNGAIVHVSSISAQRTVAELLAFSVSCAGLDQVTRSLAASLAPHAIRVNSVALGSIMTADLRDALRGREELRDKMVEVTPLGRIGEAAEVAEAILFLASPAASFITGQILVVDGGRLVLDPLQQPI
ncbi:MAG: SDR family oxidoreductase [Alphaproteobacteria bacterium]|nr:MAG: SDR family oxidoreductase [Alphaproteobacteria bacterium]